MADGPKIVRDLLASRIPAIALMRAADPDQHRRLLLDKSAEEVAEIRDSGYADPGEYADALEVLVSLAEISGIDWEEVERLRVAKRRERGGFVTGLVYHPALDPDRGRDPTLSSPSSSPNPVT